MKLGWDDPLAKDLADEFLDWMTELKIVSKYSFKRYLICENDGELAPPLSKKLLNSTYLLMVVAKGTDQ